MPRDYNLYLEDILESIDRINEYVSGMTYEDFVSDRKTVDAVVRNLEVIGEAAKSVPDEARQRCQRIEWPKVVGLRNLLIHAYFGVSLPIVWDVVTNKLTELSAACRELLQNE
jgi:uncharacterized protein with HEPN domain